MGRVSKQIAKREKEKHLTTEEYIALVKWYIEECNKLDAQWARDKNNLNDAFKARLDELRKLQEARG